MADQPLLYTQRPPFALSSARNSSRPDLDFPTKSKHCCERPTRVPRQGHPVPAGERAQGAASLSRPRGLCRVAAPWRPRTPDSLLMPAQGAVRGRPPADHKQVTLQRTRPHRRGGPRGPPSLRGRPAAVLLLLRPARRGGRWRVFIKQIESMAAYPQQIVTTRLLYCLQDRIEQLSRMQRIYPHAW